MALDYLIYKILNTFGHRSGLALYRLDFFKKKATESRRQCNMNEEKTYVAVDWRLDYS